MKNILLTFAIALGLALTTKAQVITCIPCEQISMVVNVGSDTTSLNIYHAGQYLTHPQEHNIFSWEFTDNQGNIIFKDTIVDDSHCSFSHNFPITDTMNVTVYLRNDSANLDSWYINQGLPTNGNSINCLFEDKIFWMTGEYPSGTPWGRWEFVTGDYSNPGVDLNVVLALDDIIYQKKELIKIIDILGRETKKRKNEPLFYIYDDGTVEKRLIIE
ncbi:hypothetical protein OAX32_04220 [Flavobacteriales bacterium]|nr:hypothetical protein [Flavobacteriales bacterium]